MGIPNNENFTPQKKFQVKNLQHKIFGQFQLVVVHVTGKH